MSGSRADERAGLLAQADSGALITLADRITEHETVEVTQVPTVGTVLFQVREPVASHRFHLGDVLVTEARVAIGDLRGWTMRLGEDRDAALAGAICDAAARSPRWAADVELLCEDTRAALAHDDRTEWDELAPTMVAFEELDA